MTSATVTLDAALLEAADTLRSAGVANARRVARTVWASLEGMSVGQAWLSTASPVSAGQSSRLREAVRRLAAGEPLPYVVGRAGFRTLDLQVDERVLIPRPETEGLVDLVLGWARRRWGAASRRWGTAADIGTGSGCLALSLIAEGRFERVIATDVSMAALAVARRNAAESGFADRIAFGCGDLLESLAGRCVDVILSNPPYLTETEFANLERGVREFEPSSALVSGKTGLDHTRGLLEQARTALTQDGLLAIEVDATRAGLALELAYRLGWRGALERDIFGRRRYLIATKET